MIEVLALAGMVTKVAGGISSAIKAGKDINELMPIASARMAHKKALSELRSLCRSGPNAEPGLWDMVVAETAKVRKRKKLALEAEAEKRDKIFWFISVVFFATLFAIATGGLIWGAAILANSQR